MRIKSFILTTTASLMLTACSSVQSVGDSLFGAEAEINASTPAGEMLRSLPAAKRKPVVAVYEFADQTGQHRPNDRIAEFSRAVTQGGVTILIEALAKAGGGNWFTVIERTGLEHLLRERQIISATRQQYGEGEVKLPPMLFAGVLLEGGIVSYDTNTLTGGLGAKYLGVGANTEYRQDMVTVYLRAVNTQNGEVLASVNTAKTIYSTMLSASVFKFVSYDEILQLESGVTVNEPPQLAVRQAIESAVYGLIMDGAVKGLWQFADSGAGQREIARYLARVNGRDLPEQEFVAAQPERVKPTVVEEASPPRLLVDEKPEEIIQVPSSAERHEEPKAEKKMKPQTEHDLNNGRYYQRLSDPKTRMYCTQSGCYPFPE